jgi:hypothetical protein
LQILRVQNQFLWEKYKRWVRKVFVQISREPFL